MPWARAYDIAMNTENVLIYSITRTAGRERLFKWVGVVAPSDWYLFSLRERPIALSQLEDAKKYQTATVNEDAGEQYLVAKGFAIGVNLQSSNKYELNYEKLRRGRVGLWVANDLVAHYLARQVGDDPAMADDCDGRRRGPGEHRSQAVLELGGVDGVHDGRICRIS